MKIEVNAEATIRNFNSVMTDKTKVISELLQNSRRAGASLVEFYTQEVDGKIDMVVLDNGTGISDFSDLFTLSKSGWDEELASTEGSFGLGFFSVLYSAEEVLVQSKGKAMLIDCALARQMADFGEPVVDHSCSDYTKITLKNVKLTEKAIREKLVELATYSRIPVALNGEMLEREKSFYELRQSAKEVVVTPFGNLVICSEWVDKVDIIVQDLRVGRIDKYSDGYGLNYLFSDTLPCRMPDRDVLINEAEVCKTIKDWIHCYFAEKLVQIRLEMQDDHAFLDNHFKAVVNYKPDILLDIDYLPAMAFEVVSYPTNRSDYGTDGFSHDTGLLRNTAYIAFESQVELYEAPVTANFAYLAKARIPAYTLPTGHWFYDNCIEVNDSDFIVACYEATVFDFSLDYHGGDVVVADDVKVIHVPSGHEVRLDRDAFAIDIENYSFSEPSRAMFTINGTEMPVPTLLLQGSKEFIWNQDLLLQLSSYTSEHDDWLDGELDDDLVALERQFLAAVGGDVEDILSQLLGNLPPVLADKLNGKELTMKVENGKATFELKAA